VRRPKLRWSKGWPELSCPEHGCWMGWLGSVYWICCPRKGKRHLMAGILGVIGGPYGKYYV